MNFSWISKELEVFMSEFRMQKEGISEHFPVCESAALQRKQAFNNCLRSIAANESNEQLACERGNSALREDRALVDGHFSGQQSGFDGLLLYGDSSYKVGSMRMILCKLTAHAFFLSPLSHILRSFQFL